MSLSETAGTPSGEDLRHSRPNITVTLADKPSKGHLRVTTSLKAIPVKTDESDKSASSRTEKINRDGGISLRKMSDLRPSLSSENVRRESVQVSNLHLAQLLNKRSHHSHRSDFEDKPKPRVLSPIEDRLKIECLIPLMKLIVARENESKDKTVQVEDFKRDLLSFFDSKASNEYLVDELLMKIDCMSKGAIRFEDFCQHMMYQMEHKVRMEKGKAEVYVQLPGKSGFVPHRDPIVKLCAMPYGTFIACSQRYKRLGYSDRKVQFYDFTSFEAYCQVTDFEAVPLNIHYCSTGPDSCLLVIGDTDGCVSSFTFSATREVLRSWKSAPKFRGVMPSVTLDIAAKTAKVKYVTWKVHTEWVQQVGYIKCLDRLVSCANDNDTSMVIGCLVEPSYIHMERKKCPQSQRMWQASRTSRPKLKRHASEQRVFSVHKGIKCFDYSRKLEMIVTGGQDRKIRLWNLYINKKFSSILPGHFAPIAFLAISESDYKLYSISTDRCVKIWDLLNEMCTKTISDKGHGLNGTYLGATYCKNNKVIAVAMEYKMGRICFKEPQVGKSGDLRVPVSHRYPVVCVGYNRCFKQIVSCSNNSEVKIWDFVDGSCLFKFTNAHGFAPITCMMFDHTNRRLITGGQDGCLKLWNFNTGQCLRVMKRKDKNLPVSACANVVVYENIYAVTVGWDRLVHFYCLKDTEDVHMVEHPVYSRPEKKRLLSKEDLTAVTQCGGHMLATASADGQIRIWNLVSGNITATLVARKPSGSNIRVGHVTEGVDNGIKVLLWLKKPDQDSSVTATLLATGPYSHIHFWNIQGAGKYVGCFSVSNGPDVVITAAVFDEHERYLFVGTTQGFISIWNIVTYTVGQSPFPRDTECKRNVWAHVETVTCLELINNENMMISGSTDCTLRAWTLSGDYIGTFGQGKSWDIFDPSTFCHPLIPSDVLRDPQSIPVHPLLTVREHPYTVIHEDSATKVKDPEEAPTLLSHPTYDSSKKDTDDGKDIVALLQNTSLTADTLRLRNERNKLSVVSRLGPSEYQHIHTHVLEPTPIVKRPSLTYGTT